MKQSIQIALGRAVRVSVFPKGSHPLFRGSSQNVTIIVDS